MDFVAAYLMNSKADNSILFWCLKFSSSLDLQIFDSALCTCHKKRLSTFLGGFIAVCGSFGTIGETQTVGADIAITRTGI